jgi:hypothetical protein
MKNVWVVFLILLTGCVTGKDSYSILNLETGETVSVKKASPCPDEFIGQDAQAKTFSLFTRTKDDQFEIRDVRYDGSVARTVPVPCFSASYLATYAFDMEGLAVSPNAARIAYYDEKTKDLKLFDIKKQAHQILLTNVAPSIVSLVFLRWRSENELVACVYEYGQPTARCFMIDVESKSLVFDFRPTCLYQISNALSPDGRYLVYLESYLPYQESLREKNFKRQYRIYDIRSRREVGAITVPDGDLFGEPRWVESNDGIFYDHRNCLMLYSLALNESRCLREYEPEMIIHPLTSAGRKVYYIVKPQGTSGSIYGVYVYDLDKQKESRLDKVKNNGKVIASPDGKFLITGWGL